MNLSEENTGLIRVTVKVPVYWHEPYLWAWSRNGRNAFYSWPGGIMTKDGDCYSLLVPDWVDFVVVNACNGYFKTEDIAVDGGKDIYLNIRDRDNYLLNYDRMEYFSDTCPPPLYVEDVKDVGWVIPEKECTQKFNGKLFAAAAVISLTLGAGLCIALKRRKKIRI